MVEALVVGAMPSGRIGVSFFPVVAAVERGTTSSILLPSRIICGGVFYVITASFPNPLVSSMLSVRAVEGVLGVGEKIFHLKYEHHVL